MQPNTVIIAFMQMSIKDNKTRDSLTKEKEKENTAQGVCVCVWERERERERERELRHFIGSVHRFSEWQEF